MGELRGTVASGKGEHARWMDAYADTYRAETGIAPFPGTLNVKLTHLWRMPTHTTRFTAGVPILLMPCRVESLDAFIMRTEKNDAGKGDHALDIIEIIADRSLRNTLSLHDGDEITIEFD